MGDGTDSIDEYIASFPAEVQPVLEQVRRTIREAVPGADETVSYRIPTFTLDGRYLVYFAGWQSHVSLYPLPRAVDTMEPDVSRYRSGKGTLRFSLAEPVPLDIVAAVARQLAAERTRR